MITVQSKGQRVRQIDTLLDLPLMQDDTLTATPGRILDRARKFPRSENSLLPEELIKIYAKLPRLFGKRDLDSQLGDKITRDMKWRYFRRMEKLGLIRHVSRKRYEKLHLSYSEWIQLVLIPKIRMLEALEERMS